MDRLVRMASIATWLSTGELKRLIINREAQVTQLGHHTTPIKAKVQRKHDRELLVGLKATG